MGSGLSNTLELLESRARASGITDPVQLYNQFRSGIGHVNLTDVQPPRVIEIGMARSRSASYEWAPVPRTGAQTRPCIASPSRLKLFQHLQSLRMRGIALKQTLQHEEPFPLLARRDIQPAERDVGRLEGRVVLQQLFEHRDRRRPIAARAEQERQVVFESPVGGTPLERLTEVWLGLREIPLLTEEDADVVERLGKVGPQRERASIEIVSLLPLPHLEEGVSEIVHRIRILLFGFESRLEVRYCAGQFAALREERAQCVVRVRVLRIEHERALEGGRRIRRSAALHLQRAEVAERNRTRVRLPQRVRTRPAPARRTPARTAPDRGLEVVLVARRPT